MKRKISRRTGMKWVTAGTLVGLGMDSEMTTNSYAQEVQAATLDAWSQTHDRVWLGGEFWANPMEDWVIKNGAAECQSVGARRSVHSTTHQITNPSAGFAMSVDLSRVAEDGSDGGAGFRVGIQSDLNEYRSNCFAGGGIDAGIVDGKLVLGRASQSLVGSVDYKAIALKLPGVANGDQVELKLVAM